MKILYVEDNWADAELMRKELAQTAPEISIITAQTVKQALSFLETESQDTFDLVLSDLHLPDGSGLDLLNHIRLKDLDLAVVIITGQGDEQTALAAVKSGANDYLPKRMGYLKELPAVLEGALKRFKTESEMRKRSLRVLYAEHLANDIDLTRRHMAAHAPYIQLDVLNSGPEVLSELAKPGYQAKWDVILLDYHLPGMNALDIIRELNQRGDHPPIIIITGQGNEEVAAQALRLGAQDYIIKNPGYLYQLAPAIQNTYHLAKIEREHAALIESEQRYQRLVQNAEEIIYRYRLTPEPGFDFVSPAVSTITGFSPEEFYNTPDIVKSLFHPEDLPIFQAASQGVNGIDTSIILRWLHKDGRTIWTEQRVIPLQDKKGNRIALEGIARDITEKKLAEQKLMEYNVRLEHDVEERGRELQAAQEKVMKQDRLATFGRLASGVAHELRNPLGVIANAVYYLKLIMPVTDDKVREYLGILEQESNTSVQIISDLLNFTNIQVGDQQTCKVADLVKKAMEQYPLPKGISLSVNIPENIPTVFIDPHQIEKALVRLVDNAVQAMEKGGNLEISASVSTMKKAQFVTISVKDNGTGISPENMPRLFEPLFTTKPRRIGLGLALSRQLVEVNNGQIDVQSEEGKGSVFNLRFPVKAVTKG